ncbi:MAG TPA: dTDP-4-dehydrorhamnose 3,5-epimerase [Tepidisphaeraceae bacterium]|nr:dTDP-4-dehydrorhamnose 3,5-epimerase [Tepidisphaeraceae bacterium]
MIYTPTKLAGAVVLEPQPIRDERGFFAYLLDVRDAQAHGLSVGLAQVKLSYNFKKGTLRGMHWQAPPAAEVKLVRCTRGAILDVIVDLRADSPTYLQHIAVELTADNRKALYVPQLFAHGYQTLTDDVEVVYQVDEFYAPQHERGLRYDDPALGIHWPLPVSSLSRKDASWPLIRDGRIP